MEENRQYGIWKNHLPFHTMPCQLVITFLKSLRSLLKSGLCDSLCDVTVSQNCEMQSCQWYHSLLSQLD